MILGVYYNKTIPMLHTNEIISCQSGGPKGKTDKIKERKKHHVRLTGFGNIHSINHPVIQKIITTFTALGGMTNVREHKIKQ